MEDVQTTAPEPATFPSTGTRVRSPAGRVLLAEDDDETRLLMAAFLRTHGYAVVEARDGIEVLDRLTSTIWATRPKLFGAIVSDLHMPGLNGLDLLAALRCSRLDVPVILITAFPDADSYAEADELGVFAYLEKPITAVDLGRVVEGALVTPRRAWGHSPRPS